MEGGALKTISAVAATVIGTQVSVEEDKIRHHALLIRTAIPVSTVLKTLCIPLTASARPSWWKIAHATKMQNVETWWAALCFMGGPKKDVWSTIAWTQLIYSLGRLHQIMAHLWTISTWRKKPSYITAVSARVDWPAASQAQRPCAPQLIELP